MKLYLTRALHYLLKIAVIITLVFIALDLTHTLDTGGQGMFHALLHTRRGLILLAAIVLLGAMYPRWSFGTTDVVGDMDADRQKILGAMADYNYVLKRERPGEMIFRNRSALRRLLSQCDDAITLTADGGRIAIEGMKKDVARVQLRLLTFLEK